MKILFYAPMKSPEHPVPSGDRRVARLLLAALREAGYQPELASSVRTFDKKGDVDFQADIVKKSHIEAEKIIASFEGLSAADRPVAWFSYHLYHKAPDLIGPLVTKRLGIPYLVAEASHAPKQKGGRWNRGYQAAKAAITHADKVFHMTQLDGECLKAIVKKPEALVYLAPFLNSQKHEPDGGRAKALVKRAGGTPDKLTLLSVGMMREGDKMQSFSQLEEALDYLQGDDWQLLIVGDGEARSTVESLFERHKDNVIFLGQLDLEDLFCLYYYSDLYVWPAHGEAYGMAFLEAGSVGLPIVAGDIRGVPDVVLKDETGLLSPARDMKSFSQSIRFLLDNAVLRQKMGKRAIEFVTKDRNLSSAAKLLAKNIQQVTR